MIQTLLTTLALVLATTITFTQIHASTRAEVAMIQNELSLAANSVATEKHEALQQEEFDENEAGTPANPGNFTAESDFGAGVTSWSDAETVGDVDDLSEVVEVTTTEGPLRFRVDADVKYVERGISGGFVPVGDKTFYKQVQLTVTFLGSTSAEVVIEKTRIYNYQD